MTKSSREEELEAQVAALLRQLAEIQQSDSGGLVVGSVAKAGGLGSVVAQKIKGNVFLVDNHSITYIIQQARHEDEVLDEARLRRQIAEYLAWVRDRFGMIELRGIYREGSQVIQLDLDSVYVSLTASTYVGTRHSLDLCEILAQGNRLVITGAPGSGKTTVLQYIACTLATAIIEDNPTLARDGLGLLATDQETQQPFIPLPVMVPLSLYAQYLQRSRRDSTHGSFVSFISQYMVEKQSGLDLSQDFFARLLRTGRGVMLLLDGLDEVLNESERVLVREAIENLVTGRELMHIAVTSRIAAYRGRTTLGKGFHEVQIEALNDEHIAILIRNAYNAIYANDPTLGQTKTDELLRGIRDLETERQRRLGDNITRLVYSPLLVRMLLVVHLNDRRLPIHRAELYTRAIDTMLWPEYTLDEEAAQYIGRQVGGTLESHRELVQHLAFYMHTKGPEQGREISEDDIRSVLGAVTEFAPLVNDFLAVTRLRGTLLEERMGTYRFVHLAFQEYLTARYLAEVVRAEGGVEQIVRFFEEGPILETWWREPALLVVGYLSLTAPRAARAFVQRIAGINRPDEVAAALSPDVIAACIEVAGLASLEAGIPEFFPPTEMAIQYMVRAGFELLEGSGTSLFICKPKHRAWGDHLNGLTVVKVLLGVVLEMSTVLTLVEEGAHLLGEKPRYIIVLCDQAPSDGAWLQIAALRAAGILVMPVDDSVLHDGRQQNRHLAVFLAHLEERYLGPQRDLYDRQNPISDRLNFFGREPLADQLADNLQQGHAVALFGLRKMGKSSLLNYVRDRLPYPAAVIDLQVSTVLKDIYDRIVAAWLARLQILQPTLNWQPPPLSADETPSAYFSRIVRSLLAALEGVRAPAQLAVFVDEIELIYPHKETELTEFNPPQAIVSSTSG